MIGAGVWGLRWTKSVPELAPELAIEKIASEKVGQNSPSNSIGSSSGSSRDLPSHSNSQTAPQADISSSARTGCFLAKFKHPRGAGHSSHEDCSKHQNQIELAPESGILHALQEKGSVCVKVDGNSVEYEK